MRVVRFEDESGQACWGSRQGDDDDSVRLMAHNDQGVMALTDRIVQPVRYLAPVIPTGIVCVAANYAEHARESGAADNEHPVLFLKLPGAVQDPDGPIVLPRQLRSDQVDYEGELAVVVGQTCRNVTPEEALGYVLGYTCANDVSARDWQKQWGGGQFCRGKMFDTFCPLGPALATPDEIPDPQNLSIRTRLNGELMQEGHTSQMTFSIAELIAFISGSTTLLPGTVVLTGTPAGVGAARDPQVFLQPGDQVSVEIEKIGTLSNPVIEEPL